MSGPAPKYVIDTCSLLKLRQDYARDVFPSVWDKIAEMADAGVLMSVEDVLEELKANEDDEVTVWAMEHEAMFLPLSGPIQTLASTVLGSHPGLIDLKKKKSGADPFLIAAALVHSCALVTEENPSGGPEKPKIPNVCNHYSVRCIKLLDLLRQEGFRL